MQPGLPQAVQGISERECQRRDYCSALLPHAQFPLRSTGAESNCLAMLVSGRWHARLGKGSSVLSAQLPLSWPLSATTSLHFCLLLHLSGVEVVPLFSQSGSLGMEFQLQSQTLILWVLPCKCVHGNEVSQFSLRCGVVGSDETWEQASLLLIRCHR